MAIGWQQHLRQNSYLERRRTKKLLRKAQKAKAIDKIDEVMSVFGWNRRFGKVAELRSRRA